MIDAMRDFVPERKGVLSQEVDGEIILIDTNMQRTHLLNNVAALVWRSCDGQKNVAEIAHALQLDIDAVLTSLRKFESAGMLEKGFPSPIERALSRRTLIAKVATAAVVALPQVVSVSLPLNSASASPPKKNQVGGQRRYPQA
jgi:hypothetical protein